MTKLLVILFIMKLIAQMNISKYTYYHKYAYYPVILHHPLSYNYAKNVCYSKAIIYPKYTYYPIATLSNTRFIWLPSKWGLNFDLVLCSSSGNWPQLTTQCFLLVKPDLVERLFHFQASIWLFQQHDVYLQMFKLCELRANDLDKSMSPFQKFLLRVFASFSLLQCARDLFAPSLLNSFTICWTVLSRFRQ